MIRKERTSVHGLQKNIIHITWESHIASNPMKNNHVQIPSIMKIHHLINLIHHEPIITIKNNHVIQP